MGGYGGRCIGGNQKERTIEPESGGKKLAHDFDSMQMWRIEATRAPSGGQRQIARVRRSAA